MKSVIPDWLPKLFVKAEGSVREATTKKFSDFQKITDTEGMEVVGLKGGANVRADIPPATTSMIATEPNDVVRALDTPELLNQKEVNRYLSAKINDVDGAHSDVEARVSEGEATQQDIIDQIQAGLEDQQEIKDKVAALEGAVGEHSFVFEGVSQNPREGQFILKDENGLNTNMLSAGRTIIFSPTDRAGNTVAWSRVGVGDVLRFSDLSQQTDEIRITGQITDSSFFYEKISGEQDRLSEYPYDFVLLSSFDPAGLASIAYVDERDATKIGKGGNQGLDNGTRWQLRQLDNGGVVRALITIEDGKMNLGHVATPSLDDDAVNKSYVDEAIAAALANMPSATPKPANFSWLYGGESTWYPNSYAFFTDGNSFKLSLKTYGGNAGSGPVITPGSYKEWNASNGSAIEMSFWYLRNDGSWKMLKHVEIDKVYWMEESNGVTYMRFHKKWQSNSNSFTTNREYYITVGGFF